MTTRIQNEHAANLALHHTYMLRGWRTGMTLCVPSNGRSHYVPMASNTRGSARGVLFVMALALASVAVLIA